MLTLQSLGTICMLPTYNLGLLSMFVATSLLIWPDSEVHGCSQDHTSNGMLNIPIWDGVIEEFTGVTLLIATLKMILLAFMLILTELMTLSDSLSPRLIPLSPLIILVYLRITLPNMTNNLLPDKGSKPTSFCVYCVSIPDGISTVVHKGMKEKTCSDFASSKVQHWMRYLGSSGHTTGPFEHYVWMMTMCFWRTVKRECMGRCSEDPF